MPFDYYDRLPAKKKAVYRRSDGSHLPPIADPAPVHAAADALRQALETGVTRRVQTAAARLAARVVEAYGCAPVEVKVRSRRPKSSRSELHGLYEWQEGELSRIQIWMRTASRRDVVSFKTFLRTLAHELCHHLDVSLFGLEESFHTEGFFRRESALVRALLPPSPAGKAPPRRKREPEEPEAADEGPVQLSLPLD